MSGVSYHEAISKAAHLLKNASKVVALTGAGISTPSGIPDFRSPESGVWEKVDPMEVASIYGFVRKPQAFYDWMRPLANTLRTATPNPAHEALAQLEEAGFLHAIITQNIDMLHTRAGSRRVYEMHGHMRQATCIQCQNVVEAEPYFDRLVENGDVPQCPDCAGVLKPNVVLFGEMLPVDVLQAAEQASRECDVMLVAGSSLTVTPVADFPEIARAGGASLILVNFLPTYIDSHADVVIHDDVARVLPAIAAVLV